MDEKILDYMTKTEYAAEREGVVKSAEHADTATGSQFAENAFKLGGNESTYYASATAVTTLGTTVNGVLTTANTAQASANRAQETADMAKTDAAVAKNVADNAQAAASEAKTNAAIADAKAVAAQTAAEAAKEPAGCMKFFAGETLPDGYLWCDGTSYPSNGDYKDLFEIIGTRYNKADDLENTFRVPDMRGRVSVGKDSGTFSKLGNVGGEEKHTLTIMEIPSHDHVKASNGFTTPTNVVQADANFWIYPSGALPTPRELRTGTTGEGKEHNNLQPYLVCNYIIKY